MRRLKLLASLVVFMIAGFAYHTATNVTESDVAAYHRLEQRLGWFRAFPGDVVALAPDGSSAEPICSVEVPPDYVDKFEVRGAYVNSLGRVLPRFEDAWAYLNGIVADIGEAADEPVYFDGELRALMADGQPGLPETDMVTRSFTPHSCECAMARRLARGHRVCTVSAALVKDGDGPVWAIQFKTFSNYVNPEQFAKCGLAYTEQVAEQVEEVKTEPCNFRNLPWDAVWRSRLGLIEVDSGEPEEIPDATDLHLSAGSGRASGRTGL